MHTSNALLNLWKRIPPVLLPDRLYSQNGQGNQSLVQAILNSKGITAMVPKNNKPPLAVTPWHFDCRNYQLLHGTVEVILSYSLGILTQKERNNPVPRRQWISGQALVNIISKRYWALVYQKIYNAFIGSDWERSAAAPGKPRVFRARWLPLENFIPFRPFDGTIPDQPIVDALPRHKISLN